MKCFIPVLLVGVLSASLPVASQAVPVDITDSITGGSNSTGLLGGVAPTGGTATVRWSMTALYGVFVQGAPGTLLTLSITAGAIAFTQPPHGFTVPVAYGAGSIALGIAPTHPTFTVYWRVAARTTGPFSFKGYYYIGGTTLKLIAIGSEVYRVPEPSTLPLAGLGLLALSGYAACRRARRHTRRT